MGAVAWGQWPTRVCHVVDGRRTGAGVRSLSGWHPRYLAPCGHGFAAEVPVGSGAREMSAMVEQIVDSGVAGQEASGAAGRSESLHLPLPPTNRHKPALPGLFWAVAPGVPPRN